MLRITRATNLYQNGVELALISRILGHSSTETTKIYATPSIEMLRIAIESVETPEQSKEKPLWENCNEEEIAKLFIQGCSMFFISSQLALYNA